MFHGQNVKTKWNRVSYPQVNGNSRNYKANGKEKI